MTDPCAIGAAVGEAYRNFFENRKLSLSLSIIELGKVSPIGSARGNSFQQNGTA